MKRILKAAVAAVGFAALATGAAAEWAPKGPIKLMIAFAAGGGADTQARLVAEDLEAKFGWQFIPEQVTGKGGMNMAMAMKDMPADGTVFGMGASETLGYNMRVANAGVKPSDFTAIATTASFQMGVVSASAKGWKTWDDLKAAAANGETIRFGVMSPKLADLAYLLGKAQGIDFNIVSVKGGKAVMNGVMAGDMDVGFMAGIQAKGVKSGDLIELASGLSKPLKNTPDAPTLADLGVEFNADGYFTFFGPGGMPAETRDAIAAAIAEVVSTEGMKSNGMVTKAFGAPDIVTGDELQALVEADFDAAGRLLQAASE
ncbi:MAG: tripartite tricarboxylate transporter substrate-binding protein [Marivita sp.]